MLPEQLYARLAEFSRLSYDTNPTPIEPLNALTRELQGPQLWIKRDDGLGPAMGGNKGRKLEFIMAEVLTQGKSKVATFGGLQSNHVRMTAAASAALGLEAHLFFFERRPRTMIGNLLLDQLLGARLHFIPFGGGQSASMTIETTIRLVRLVARIYAGRDAYFMPVGGHSVTGCLGYVVAACELHQQLAAMNLAHQPVTLVTAAGTGGTLVGLLAGLTLLNTPIRLLAIDVGKLWKAFPDSLARLASDVCSRLGESHRFRPDEVPIIEREYVGPGYAVFTEESKKAIRIMARSEGIFLDPIYTGKAFAGLLDLIDKDYFGAGEHVIFLHTGGAPGLWAGVFTKP